MGAIRKARAASGLLAVVTLLGLFVFEVSTKATLDPNRIRILVILIAGLLGLDLLGENLPLDISVQSGGETGGETDETND
ncbi:hypothetical protein HrrHc1_150 [Halorubrum phage Hardycor1]|nr:hypothetical protein HrrHc1_150 [Halorubrum phage Hardycor1]